MKPNSFRGFHVFDKLSTSLQTFNFKGCSAKIKDVGSYSTTPTSVIFFVSLLSKASNKKIYGFNETKKITNCNKTWYFWKMFITRIRKVNISVIFLKVSSEIRKKVVKN